MRPSFGKLQSSPRLPPYVYRDLESATHTRILELLPIDASEPKLLRCRIHHMDLDTPAFEYTAISYAWGDTSIELRKQLPTTEGTAALIPPTLYSCLRRLQPKTNSLFLWADAVCINQAENELALRERSAQVTLMRRIFSAAEDVIVELGDVPEDDEILVQAFRKVACVEKGPWKSGFATAKDVYRAKIERRLYRYPFEALGPDCIANLSQFSSNTPCQNDPFWPTFERFLQRSWFRRIWIVQELSLAKQVSFHLGSYSLSETVFRRATKRAIDLLFSWECVPDPARSQLGGAILKHALTRVSSKLQFQAAKDTSQQRPGNERMVAIKAVRRFLFETRKCAQIRATHGESWLCFVNVAESKGQNPLSIGYLWNAFREFQCSDARDRVYGLLALADDGNTSDMYVDYTETPQEVSIRTSLYLLKQGLVLTVLYQASQYISLRPSWALSVEDDGGRHTPLANFMCDNSKGKSPLYQAAGATEFEYRTVANSKQYLIVQGRFVATVESQSSVCPIEARSSISNLINSASTWGCSVAGWMHTTAKWALSGRSESEWKLECFRVLLADLKDGSRQQGINVQRIGTGEEAGFFLRSMAFWIPHPSERRKPMRVTDSNWKQRLQKEWDAQRTLQTMDTVMPGRRLGIAMRSCESHTTHSEETKATAGGLTESRSVLCQLPTESEVGDRLAIINGCPIPFVLRKSLTTESFSLVGVAYVHEMMDGQAIDERWPQQDIVLI